MNKHVNRYEKLEFGKFYHILNRAVGKELLFKSKNDYFFFILKFKHYILPIADIYAYCLMPNHFHYLMRIKDEKDLASGTLKIGNNNKIHQIFGNFFTSYSKSFNKVYNRKGSLFIHPFKRILIDDESYLLHLIAYIHRNPIHHNFTKEYDQWKFSSYNAIVSNTSAKTNVKRREVIEMFGSIEDFIIFHQQNKPKKGIGKYLLE